jgi:hypothetical protein
VPILCFEVWKNDQKLTTAGVSETGVLSVILSWAGREPNASSIAASSAAMIPNISLSVGGIEGITHVNWHETDKLKVGDELRVRLISSEHSDPPIHSEAPPRGNPDWIKKYRPE